MVVLASQLISNLTNGILNTFVVALIFGIGLRTAGVFKPSVLNGIDAFGLMMLAILIMVFGPLATLEPADLARLAVPLLIAFVAGLLGIALFAAVTGKLLGFSVPMSIAIGLTSLYGFPGTMILSQEAAKGAGEITGGSGCDRERDPAQDDRGGFLDRDDHLGDRHRFHRASHRTLADSSAPAGATTASDGCGQGGSCPGGWGRNRISV